MNNIDWIKRQLFFRGITSKKILEAFEKVPRELFVPSEMRYFVDNDAPIPIGYGQTTSQPYIIALMIQYLNLSGDEKVLEIGTGRGYQTAILSHLAKEVYSIEIIPQLADEARERLKKLGIKNVQIFTGDGTLGLPQYAPYDAIIVSAFSPSVPSPLLDQLADGGRLIIPIGSTGLQYLYLYKKKGDNIEKVKLDSCVFVPLKGEYGLDNEQKT